jgi:hypothetical protein
VDYGCFSLFFDISTNSLKGKVGKLAEIDYELVATQPSGWVAVAPDYQRGADYNIIFVPFVLFVGSRPGLLRGAFFI